HVVTFPQLVPDTWPRVEFALLAEQKVIEEGAQPGHWLRLVEVSPLLAPVDFQPLLARGNSPEAFQSPAWVQALVRPARHDKGREGDSLQIGGLRFPEIVAQRVLGVFGRKVLDFRDGMTPARREVAPEARLGNAAVTRNFPVGVRPAFPWIDRREMRR